MQFFKQSSFQVPEKNQRASRPSILSPKGSILSVILTVFILYMRVQILRNIQSATKS